MKKLLAILCAIGLITAAGVNTAKAQSPVNFGLRAGLNFANFNDLDGEKPDSRTGLMVGGYLNFKVPMSPISIQPEVLYSQKGAEEAGTTIELDYLEIPVLAKFSFAPGPATPHVYFGPYVGFVLKSEVSSGGASADIDNTQTDFGGIVGAGLDLNLGVTELNAGVRYGFGLTDAFDGGQGKNGVFSIVAGVAL
jgi:hypothetical protein